MDDEIVFQLPHTEIAGLQCLTQDPQAITLLSLHGWLDNAESFSNVFSSLPDFNHIALDLAGHGFSSHRPEGSFYHLWDYVLDVVAVLNQLNKKVWLVGHSMGGAVAMLVATVVQDKVHGVVLLDNIGPLSGDSESRVDTMQRSIARMLRHRPEKKTSYASKEEMVNARMNGFTKLSEPAASALVSRGAVERSNNDWVWRHDSKLSFPSPFRMDEAAVRAFIKNVKCPTLVLMAKSGIYEKNLDLVGERIAEFFECEVQWFAGNHHFHLEPYSFASVAKEIQCFVDKH